jgi:hypothetical protein
MVVAGDNKDEIDAMFMKSLSGEEAQGYTLLAYI